MSMSICYVSSVYGQVPYSCLSSAEKNKSDEEPNIEVSLIPAPSAIEITSGLAVGAGGCGGSAPAGEIVDGGSDQSNGPSPDLLICDYLLPDYLPAIDYVTLPDLVPEPMKTPTGLTATAGDQKVDLTCDADPRAVEYIIYGSEDPTKVMSTQIGTAQTNQYTHAPLLNGNKYYYAIRTKDINGIYSDFSQIISVRLPIVCELPTSIFPGAVTDQKIFLGFDKTGSLKSSFRDVSTVGVCKAIASAYDSLNFRWTSNELPIKGLDCRSNYAAAINRGAENTMSFYQYSWFDVNLGKHYGLQLGDWDNNAFTPFVLESDGITFSGSNKALAVTFGGDAFTVFAFTTALNFYKKGAGQNAFFFGETIDSGLKLVRYPVVASEIVKTFDYPVVAYYAELPNGVREIRVARYSNPGFIPETIATIATPVQQRISLAVKPRVAGDEIHLTFIDGNVVKYAFNNGNGWVVTTVAIGKDASLTLDQDGSAIITYTDEDANCLVTNNRSERQFIGTVAKPRIIAEAPEIQNTLELYFINPAEDYLIFLPGSETTINAQVKDATQRANLLTILQETKDDAPQNIIDAKNGACSFPTVINDAKNQLHFAVGQIDLTRWKIEPRYFPCH